MVASLWADSHLETFLSGAGLKQWKAPRCLFLMEPHDVMSRAPEEAP